MESRLDAHSTYLPDLVDRQWRSWLGFCSCMWLSTYQRPKCDYGYTYSVRRMLVADWRLAARLVSLHFSTLGLQCAHGPVANYRYQFGAYIRGSIAWQCGFRCVTKYCSILAVRYIRSQMWICLVLGDVVQMQHSWVSWADLDHRLKYPLCFIKVSVRCWRVGSPLRRCSISVLNNDHNFVIIYLWSTCT
jgi:hypothetical protein